MSELNEKLKKLGFKKANSLPVKKNHNKKPLADFLGGINILNNSGEVILLEKLFPFGGEYGNITFKKDGDFNEFYKLNSVKVENPNLHKHLFIDTETTGLSGGTGTIPFLIGYGYFSESGFQVRQLLLENPIFEPAQLLEFSKIAPNFENTITFNGKSFDLPLLRTRYVLNKFPDPLIDFRHIDLLHLARRIWKNRLTDRSLKELERQILNYSRSSEEIPGWMIPQVYFDFLRTGDSELLKNVAYHNALDIASMAALFIKINGMLNEIHYSNEIEIRDLFSIGMMYHQINELEKAQDIYKFCLDSNKLNTAESLQLNKRMAEINKKSKDWEKAVIHWTLASKLSDLESCIELSKFYEHIQKDYPEAYQWVVSAEKIAISASIPGYRKRILLQQIEKRKNRLERSAKNVS